MSLSLYTVIAEQLKTTPAATSRLLPEQCILQCTGELDAQVALLQSLIPLAVKSFYHFKNPCANPITTIPSRAAKW